MSQQNYKLPEEFKESNLYLGKWRYKIVTNKKSKRFLFLDTIGKTLVIDRTHYNKTRSEIRTTKYFGRYK